MSVQTTGSIITCDSLYKSFFCLTAVLLQGIHYIRPLCVFKVIYQELNMSSCIHTSLLVQDHKCNKIIRILYFSVNSFLSVCSVSFIQQHQTYKNEWLLAAGPHHLQTITVSVKHESVRQHDSFHFHPRLPAAQNGYPWQLILLLLALGLT